MLHENGGVITPASMLPTLWVEVRLHIEDEMEEKYIAADDGHRIFLRIWRAENTRATVHINHGMAEHSARYQEFAEKLCAIGCTVYAQDHRGHGYTKEDDEKGWFAERDGWKRVAEDAWEVDKAITIDFPGVPHILFGHSMGSFIARTCLALHSDAYAAAIICGTGASQGLAGRIGRLIALHHAGKFGSKMPDQTMEKLAFGSYAGHFPGEGEYGWLSRDRNEVRKYEDDPLCGFTCSSSFYADLIEGSFTANDKKLAAAIRKDIPILIISGEDDPVGGYGKGVRKVFRLYKDAGIANVRMKLFPKDRHEILNELDKADVMECIVSFIESVLGEEDGR